MTDLHKRIARRGLSMLPWTLRMGRAYRQWTPFLGEASRWDRDAIEAWQLDRLREIVLHAYLYTEGYRELYRQAGIRPGDIRSLSDIALLPFVEKRMFQDNLEAFSAPERGRQYGTTGGSTGIPLGFYHSPNLRSVERAFVHACWQRWGWKPNEPYAVLRGGYVGSARRLTMYDPSRRELHLSTYLLNAGNLSAFLHAIGKYGAVGLHAFPSALNVLCDLLLEPGAPPPPPLRLIMLSSENTYSWQLRKVEKAFPGVPILDLYGHSERAIFADWCPGARRYHVNPFYGFTELLKGSSPAAEGETGELVGTSFHNRATPFIRYRTGDLAAKGAPGCAACGSDFAMLDAIAGRKHEFILTGTGRYISMSQINMHDSIFDPISQFQFFQEEAGRLVFRYVPKKSELAIAETSAMLRGLSRKLGSDVELTLVPVDQIPRTRSGKLKCLDQRMQLQYGYPS